MRRSKAILGWILVILAIVTIVVIGTYRSIHKTCCSEDLSTNELREIVNDADHGDVAAMKRLYFFYEEGEEPAKAKLWLRRAADRGDAEAEMFMYEDWRWSNDAKQHDAAVGYLKLAAEHGSVIAQRVLGESYRDGNGVPRSDDRAAYWLRKSALSGDEVAVLGLCELALAQHNRSQCEECLRLDTQAAAALDPRLYLAKELANQHDRLARRLKDWDRGPE